MQGCVPLETFRGMDVCRKVSKGCKKKSLCMRPFIETFKVDQYIDRDELSLNKLLSNMGHFSNFNFK